MKQLNPLRVLSLAVRFLILLLIVAYLEGDRDISR